MQAAQLSITYNKGSGKPARALVRSAPNGGLTACVAPGKYSKNSRSAIIEFFYQNNPVATHMVKAPKPHDPVLEEGQQTFEGTSAREQACLPTSCPKVVLLLTSAHSVQASLCSSSFRTCQLLNRSPRYAILCSCLLEAEPHDVQRARLKHFSSKLACCFLSASYHSFAADNDRFPPLSADPARL